jgi:hypothetical protein
MYRVSASIESEAPITAISPINSFEDNESASKSYAKAYYDVVANIINHVGFYSENDDYEWQYDMGFVRGDLIDFDGDGIPELVCIYRKEYFHNVSIYRYSNDQAELLVDELTGNSIIGDNISHIFFDNINGKPYIDTENCVWGKEENIKIFSVENGKLIIKTFNAQAEVNDGLKRYFKCIIDGDSVSLEDYIAQKEYYNGVYWNQIFENGEYRDYTKDDAVKFIKSLANDAGIREDKVNNLLVTEEVIRSLDARSLHIVR